jgi:Mn2+/Fe2+ NRAMP family transporter
MDTTPVEPNPVETIKQPDRPKLLQVLGPGLITGASDDDPGGIATYSQVGAQFGYGMAWVMLFSWPLMCAIQEISARIGRVTGRGIAGNLKHHYPIGLVYAIVSLLVVANIISARTSARWPPHSNCLLAARPLCMWRSLLL